MKAAAAMASISTTAILIYVVMLLHGDVNEAADTYNARKEICCNSKVYDQNPSSTMQCCGDESFDMKESICCNGQVVPRPNNTLVYPYISRPLFGCCHDVVYDAFKQTCCGKQLWDIPENDAWYNQLCCGDVLWNFKTHMCCGGQLLSNSGLKIPGCCGSNIIDFSSANCCIDTDDGNHQYNAWVNPHSSVNKNCCSRNASEDETSESVLERYVLCCGEHTYDPKNQLCCGNKVLQRSESSSLEGCCGERIYNGKNQVCCEEIIYDKISNDTKCCGNSTFEQVNQICCENKVIPVDDVETSRCCRGEPFVYDEK